MTTPKKAVITGKGSKKKSNKNVSFKAGLSKTK